MNPLRRLLIPGIILLIIVLTGLLGYVKIEGWTPIEALYMVIITISTVGFREVHDLNTAGRLLTIGIIDIAARNALLTFLPFVLLQKGIPVAQVGFALTLLFAGGAVGKFSCGVLAEWFGVIPMVVGTEILTTAGILSLYWSAPSIVWFILPLLGIVLNGTSSVLYATVAEIISPTGRSRGYGLYYAITLGSGAISPMIYGLITDSLGLSFTIISTALMVLITLPLSRYLSRPAKV